MSGLGSSYIDPIFWGFQMDDEFCRERARTVRALAEQADPFIKERLLKLATHYERRISFGVKAQATGEQKPQLRQGG
jgi:hypothetical protein